MKPTEINHQFYEKIGLIGGMGSGATIETYRKIMKFARYEGGFSPHLIINNLPQENIFDQLEESVATMICHGIEDLASAGASVVGISCNTAHIYIKSIKAEAERRQIKFVNMIDSVVNHCGRSGYRRVGILATPKGCEIYRHAIKAGEMEDIEPSPEHQHGVNQVIRAVLEGRIGPEQRHCLERVRVRMYEQGCDTVILGCTELPLVFGESAPAGYVCSISLLAESLLQAACPLNQPK